MRRRTVVILALVVAIPTLAVSGCAVLIGSLIHEQLRQYDSERDPSIKRVSEVARLLEVQAFTFKGAEDLSWCSVPREAKSCQDQRERVLVEGSIDGTYLSLASGRTSARERALFDHAPAAMLGGDWESLGVQRAKGELQSEIDAERPGRIELISSPVELDDELLILVQRYECIEPDSVDFDSEDEYGHIDDERSCDGYQQTEQLLYVQPTGRDSVYSSAEASAGEFDEDEPAKLCPLLSRFVLDGTPLSELRRTERTKADIDADRPSPGAVEWCAQAEAELVQQAGELQIG
jgi:hypothetical protein